MNKSKKAPSSPVRTVFKKKKRESETYQELQETMSSDNDNASSYLPSSLRLEGIKNSSPTKNFDGIQQLKTVCNKNNDCSMVKEPVDVPSESNDEGSIAPADIKGLKSLEDLCTIHGDTLTDPPALITSPKTGKDIEDYQGSVFTTSHRESDDHIMAGYKESTDNLASAPIKLDTHSKSPTTSTATATIPQDQARFQSSSEFKTSPRATEEDTDADSSPSGNKKAVEGILRTPCTDTSPSASPSEASFRQHFTDHFAKNKKIKSSKKAVSFADENGGIISEQQTIDVSPSKLSRKIRRGKGLPSGYDIYDDDDETSKVHTGVMGRVLVLLMDPPTKQYELTSVPYPLVSNEDEGVGPTQLKVILGLVETSASYEPLRNKKYKGFMRPDDTEIMDNDMTILDYKFIKDEVLVAIPEGYSVEECGRFSKPILQDKRLVKLLKKLKRHERKAEKKRRLKLRQGMKPNRYGIEMDVHSQELYVPQQETRMFRDGIFVKSVRFLGILCIFLLVMSILLGASQYVQEKKAQEQLLLLKKPIHEKDDKACGKGSFCKPFGVKVMVNEKDFVAKLRDAISKWKLESDDLML